MRRLGSVLLLVALSAPAFAQLPRDVESFIRQRESCDHWRGEEPYDAARKREITRGLCAECTGADSRLLRLKRKYAGNHAVSSALAEVEYPLGEMPAALCRTFQPPKRTR